MGGFRKIYEAALTITEKWLKENAMTTETNVPAPPTIEDRLASLESRVTALEKSNSGETIEQLMRSLDDAGLIRRPAKVAAPSLPGKE